MRVIFHTDQYYPKAGAGSYRIRSFADALMAQGDSVTVITDASNRMGNASAEPPHRERILYAPTIPMKKKTVLLRLLNCVSFGVNSVLWALGAGKADVVVTTALPPVAAFPGWLIARCKGAKLIYDVRDIWPDVALEMGSFAENSIYDRVFRAFSNFLYKKADAVSTVSPGKVEKLREYVAALPGDKAGRAHTDKVWLLENGFDESIDQSVLDPALIDKYELDKKPACVYIGNIGLAQGLDSLLTLAERTKHRTLRFLCFGTGADKERLEKSAKDRGLTNVSFCGTLDHSGVYSVLSHAALSIVSLKSGKMQDSVPTKLYEALGLGCPVFLLAEGDATAVLDETGLGCHVSPEETESMVAVFDSMVDRLSEYEGKKEAAIRMIHEGHSRQVIAKELAKKLHQL